VGFVGVGLGGVGLGSGWGLGGAGVGVRLGLGWVWNGVGLGGGGAGVSDCQERLLNLEKKTCGLPQQTLKIPRNVGWNVNKDVWN
jgi:hypothetical protein